LANERTDSLHCLPIGGDLNEGPLVAKSDGRGSKLTSDWSILKHSQWQARLLQSPLRKKCSWLWTSPSRLAVDSGPGPWGLLLVNPAPDPAAPRSKDAPELSEGPQEPVCKWTVARPALYARGPGVEG
jgi:hypothetical protein